MLDPPLHELLNNSSPETLTSLKLDEVGGKAHISKSSKKMEMPKKSCVTFQKKKKKKKSCVRVQRGNKEKEGEGS